MNSKEFEGFSDFKRGQLNDPYPNHSRRSQGWQLGFNKAYFQNRQKLQEKEAKEKGPKKLEQWLKVLKK